MNKLIILIFTFFLTITNLANAQTPMTSSSIKRNTATILFASIGGGILGLSTLSFYGKPQEHTDNITVGVVLGLAAGIGYLAYQSNQPTSNQFSAQIDCDRAIRKCQKQQMSFNLLSYSYAW